MHRLGVEFHIQVAGCRVTGDIDQVMELQNKYRSVYTDMAGACGHGPTRPYLYIGVAKKFCIFIYRNALQDSGVSGGVKYDCAF